MKLVDLVGLTLDATSGASMVVLRERESPHRLLPIHIGELEAASIAVAVNGLVPPRPLAHDVMAALVHSLDAHVDRVEVTELRDGSFLAQLAVDGPGGGRRIDTRPSDAIALAIRLDAPLFVSDTVLDDAGTLLAEAAGDDTMGDDLSTDEAPVGTPLDAAAIDDEVARFRSVLDDLDPSAFDEGPSGPTA